MSTRPRSAELSAIGEEQMDDLRLIREAATRLLESHQPAQLIEELYHKLARHLDLEVFLHFRYQTASRRLHLEIQQGLPGELAEQIRDLELGQGVCGEAAATRQPVVMEDITPSENRSRVVRTLGLRAYCALPLVAGDQLIGTLSFGTRQRDRFTPRQQRLLHVVCDLIAVSIQRAHEEEQRERALQRERQARQELQQAMDALNQLNDTLEQRVRLRTRSLVQHQRQLRSLASQLVLSEQRDRQRIATDLHDNLAQLLVACKMHLGLLPGESDPARLELESQLDRALHYTRGTIAEISPTLLYDCGLRPALRWLADTVMPRHGLSVELHDDGGCDRCDADLAIVVFQAVRELLINVLRHAGTSRACLEVRHHRGGLEMIVSDGGCGFHPQTSPEAPHEPEHSGFGLFSIQERMALLGGCFEISSTPGQGTRATLWVPLAPDRQADADEAGEPDAPDAANQMPQGGDNRVRILLVDDHAVVREGLTLMLRNQPGVRIVGEAGDGEDAVNRARELRPDIILMDVSMPRLNGIEATSRIVAEHPDVGIIGLSMYEDDEVASAMRDAGAAGYLCKGCSTDLLTDTIFSLAGSGAGSPGPN
ncbi:MAG: response regulator [Phycisphaeraceae bacterium]